MTTYTTCDNCASTLEVSNRVTVTMDWSNSYSAPSHDEYHFCQWPCLMTWLKKQQAKYGWRES